MVWKQKRYWVEYEPSDIWMKIMGHPIIERYKTEKAAIDAMRTMKQKEQKIISSNVICEYISVVK